ncbi:hypothetical protein VSDG_06115 [Cytospora chrysosperma]|uniref:Uncharacterized protein n=1 Tax=Cytospora chrysosperma TaxID=252740 RepID=A0A423VUD3_CYTCH|nr:hypothetical protein VSDG_06115 [Valsa sordida]
MSVARLRSLTSRSLHKSTGPKGPRERVVILGSGWAGYAFARTLDPAKYERIVVSPRSYFVFTPLLASTAVGTLEFRATLESVRRLGDVKFLQGWADDVDFDRKVVRVEENHVDDLATKKVLPAPDATKGSKSSDVTVENPALPKGPVDEVPYDKLVIAVGAYSQTFGIEGVRQHAHFLRDVGDARRIRVKVLSLFEQCASPSMSDEDRKKLLHFAIVGGGPTGIEFAAELHDLIHEDLSKMYASLLPYVQITVYDVAPKILPMFDQALASYAIKHFGRQKINVKTAHNIERIRADDNGLGGVMLKIKQYGDAEVGAGLVVWSTGLMQNPLVEKLSRKTIAGPDGSRAFRLEKDKRTGGVIVDGHLRARMVEAPAGSEASLSAAAAAASAAAPTTSKSKPEVLNDVFVIGDCCVVDGQPLPKTAQVASQQAAYLSHAFNKGAADPNPFAFRNLGTMTYLGNWKALWQKDRTDLTGRTAWVLWRTAYMTRSMSIKNRLMIPFYWFVSWLFGRDISRF